MAEILRVKRRYKRWRKDKTNLSKEVRDRMHQLLQEMDEGIEETSDLEREGDWVRAYLEETELYLVNTAPNRGSGEEGPITQSGSDRQGEETNLREAKRQQRDKLNFDAIGIDRVSSFNYAGVSNHQADDRLDIALPLPSSVKDNLEEPTRPNSPSLMIQTPTPAVRLTPATATANTAYSEAETVLRILQRMRRIADTMADAEGSTMDL